MEQPGTVLEPGCVFSARLSCHTNAHDKNGFEISPQALSCEFSFRINSKGMLTLARIHNTLAGLG